MISNRVPQSQKKREKSDDIMKKDTKCRSLAVRIAIYAALVCLLFVVWANWRVTSHAAGKTYDNTADIPAADAALVLGASPLLADGRANLYFTHRVDAAAQLYHSGRVRRIVVSGDNSRTTYNEPQAMKDALVGRGVPEEVIFLDYAGFRTLDSVVRMREIFSQDRFIVVSQRFHNERALYLARHMGIEAWGYNARDVGKSMGFRTLLREKLARPKMFLDLWLGKGPRFLGDKVDIGV